MTHQRLKYETFLQFKREIIQLRILGKYHLSKDIVHYYVKRYKITKVKKKKCIYFRKEEFDRLMEKRLSKDDLLSITLD